MSIPSDRRATPARRVRRQARQSGSNRLNDRKLGPKARARLEPGTRSRSAPRAAVATEE